MNDKGCGKVIHASIPVYQVLQHALVTDAGLDYSCEQTVPAHLVLWVHTHVTVTKTYGWNQDQPFLWEFSFCRSLCTALETSGKSHHEPERQTRQRIWEIGLRHFLSKTTQVHQQPFRQVMQCIALPRILNELFLLRYVERDSVGVCFQSNLFLSSVF